MKKKIASFAAAFVFACGVNAFAEGTFLCMKAEDSIAVTADENNNFKYIEMKASNGETVYPQISTDGNTYLPFRYICEMAGLKDGADIAGELPDGYFRYWAADPNIPNDTQKIEIAFNGSYYCHNIGESFTYELKPGDIRTVSIYNIRGSLYFPMSYMAKITDSKAIWADKSKSIIYVSNSLNSSDYLDERNELRRDKELYLGFDFFYNNLGNSSLYLKSDGVTIQSLSDEIEGNPTVKSVTRSGKNIYYISNNRIYTKNEGEAAIAPLSFTDTDGNSVDVLADTAMVVQNKLYGIKINNEGEKYGRLFRSNLDGTGFEYLTDKTVYNLILREYNGELYLYYCDASTKSDLYMIRLRAMDTYDIQITDFARNNLLSDIKQLVVGEKSVAYITNGNRLHVVNIEDNLEDFEIIRVNASNNKIYLKGTDGEALDNITSMNYDNINNVMYVAQVDYTGRTYYYTLMSDEFTRLEQSEHPITDIALFSDLYYNDFFARTVNGQAQINRVKYTDGRIETAN